jgi:hypothetical protein
MMTLAASWKLDPHHCSMMMARWQALAGQKAQKVKG